MISVHLGEGVFLNGIQDYLQKFAYKNTTTEDLWNCLSNASGKPVSQFISPWTREQGYPVVSVTENTDSSTVLVKQSRFLSTGDVSPENGKTIYPVILGLRTDAGVDNSTLLMERDMYRSIMPSGSYFKLNAEHSSVYRTLYSPELLARLGKAAQNGTLTTADRTGLVADAAALTAAGYSKTSEFLTLVQRFKEDTSFFVWKEILIGLRAIADAWMFQDPTVVKGLKAFTKDTINPIVRKLGFDIKEGESHVNQQLKELILQWAAFCGDVDTIQTAQERFRKSLNGDVQAIHPTLRTTIYSIISRYGGETEVRKSRLWC